MTHRHYNVHILKIGAAVYAFIMLYKRKTFISVYSVRDMFLPGIQWIFKLMFRLDL